MLGQPFPELQGSGWGSGDAGGQRESRVGEGEVVSCFMVSGHLGHKGNNQVFMLCGKSIGLWENTVENNRRDFVEKANLKGAGVCSPGPPMTCV